MHKVLFFSVIFLMIACTEQSATQNTGVKKGRIDTSVKTQHPVVNQNSGTSLNTADSINKNTVDKGIRPPEAPEIIETLKRPVFSDPEAGQMIEITGGTFLRGSSPDDELRDQFAENDNIKTVMTRFEMDVLPWPNDPSADFYTDVTMLEAQRICEKEGKRLCTELELEWACKGKDNRRYINGNLYDETAYDGPYGTPSPFGVWGFGKILELTSSSWGQDPDQTTRTAVRGFTETADFLGKTVSPERGRRCAKRWRFNPESRDIHMGFRCCKGKKNLEKCFIERTRPAHSIYKTIKPDEFAAIIKSIPEIAAIHDNPHMFSNGDIRAVLAKRGSDRAKLAKEGIHFTWKPLRWIPRQGMELWLAVGRSNKHSFVVALHEIKDNEKYSHESSLIIWDNPVPLALVYREGHRDEVYWAPCWRCRDGGAFEYDEEKNQVIITHRW